MHYHIYLIVRNLDYYKIMKYIKTYEQKTTPYKVFIRWEHDADSYDKEKYDFDSESDMLRFLYFIYKYRTPYLLESDWNESWHFHDNAYFRKELDELDPTNQYIDYVPSDRYDWYGSVDNIYVKINGKKHHIIWKDLLIKKEQIIDIPKKNTILDISIGEIAGGGAYLESHQGKIFPEYKGKFISYHELKDILGEGKGGYPNKVYPKVNTKLIDCKVDSNTNFDADRTYLYYEIVYEIIDEREELSHLKGKLVMGGINGYDKNFVKKFNHDEFGKDPSYLVDLSFLIDSNELGLL